MGSSESQGISGSRGESTIPRLHERIEQERASVRKILYGLMQAGGYDALHQRFTCLDERYEALADLVGDREASALFIHEYTQVIIDRPQDEWHPVA